MNFKILLMYQKYLLASALSIYNIAFVINNHLLFPHFYLRREELKNVLSSSLKPMVHFTLSCPTEFDPLNKSNSALPLPPWFRKVPNKNDISQIWLISHSRDPFSLASYMTSSKTTTDT